MLIDTHCHINIMVKKEFDVPLSSQQIHDAQKIIDAATAAGVTKIINVGTSLIESNNCVELARRYNNLYASVGIHPNDCTATWRDDLNELTKLLQHKNEYRIVGIGECGLDYHYPDYNKQRQYDAFRAQIELALEHDLAIIIHTRDASDETLHVLDEYKQHALRGVIHCFSEDQAFADHAIDIGFVLGMGGTITYPKNQELREVATSVSLESIILETDAPFLPPQVIRGKQNSPAQIAIIAQFLADLRGQSLEEVAHQTSQNALSVFRMG